MFGLEVDKDFIIGKIQQRLDEIESDHPEINFHKDESYFDEEYDKVRKDSRKFINSDHEKFVINSHNISHNIFRLDKQVYIHRYYHHMKSLLTSCQERDRVIICDNTYEFIMESKPPTKYEMELWGYDYFENKDAVNSGGANRPTPSPPHQGYDYDKVEPLPARVVQERYQPNKQEALWLSWLIVVIIAVLILLFIFK